MYDPEVRFVRVAVVTVRPGESYHLSAFSSAAASLPEVEFLHLTPDASRTPAHLGAVSEDLRLLDSADRLVVCGGSPSAWADEVVSRFPLSRQVLFSEVSFLPVQPPAPSLLADRVGVALAASAGSLPLLRSMFPAASVRMVGSPAAPTQVVTGPGFRRVLLLSRPGSGLSGPGSPLAEVYDLLSAAGFSPHVRPHPREDAGAWSRFRCDRSVSIAEAALGSAAVCGYPGTALSLLAAARYPAVALVPPGVPQVPDHMAGVVAWYASTATSAVQAVRRRQVASAEVRSLMLPSGSGDAGRRTLLVWAGSSEF